MLNLDTRFNSMFCESIDGIKPSMITHSTIEVTTQYHVLFDYDGFAFLPLVAILNMILKFTKENEKLPHGRKKLFSDVCLPNSYQPKELKLFRC